MAKSSEREKAAAPKRDEILRFCAQDPVERVFIEEVARRGLGRFVGAGLGIVGNIMNKIVGAQLLLEVSDTGCGMDAATQERILEPFFTTKPVGVGTGLGLSLSHGIIERHGGRIWLESEPGRGARFVVELPLDATPADEQA